MSDPMEHKAHFNWVGRLKETPNYVPSDKGGYAVIKLEVMRGGREWGFNAISYDDCAQEVTANCKRGDTVNIVGECTKSKNKQTGHWDNAFTAKKLVAWEEAVDTVDGPAEDFPF
jgi:hypothetical protein